MSALTEVASESEVELPTSATEYATHAAGRRFRSELPHLRLVSPLRPERASRGLFAVLITVLLAFGLVVMLLVNTSVAQTAFTVTELKMQQRDLSRTEAALTKSLAEAASPPVLEAKARSLGMVPSDRAVFVTVPDGKVRGKAKPAPGNRARTANVAGSLTATLLDPVPGPAIAPDAPASGERLQVGDGAVLLQVGAVQQVDAATEQARRNEQRQQLRQTATTDGAVLVRPQATDSSTSNPARPSTDGAVITQESAR